MSTPAPDPATRLVELLLDDALFGLDATEAAELAAWEEPTGAEAAACARAVSAAQLALASVRASTPPAGLEARLLAQASAHFAAPSIPRSSAPRAHPLLPWLLAAAALLVAALGWWPNTQPGRARALALEALLAEAPPDLLRLDWIVLDDPSTASGARGEVIWSDAAQEGYLRLSGLAANQPQAEQYQLWIFDRGQNDAYPVDGGVFDVPAEASEVIVPIDPKIAIEQAWQFAITVEKPGGVVVSSRERLPLLATAPE